MDHSTFDTLTRALATRQNQTRRAVFAAAGSLVVARLMSTPDAAARRRRKRGRRRRPITQTTCFGTVSCEYVAESEDYDDCNFAGSTAFKDGVGHGSSYRRANFNGADLSGADLSGSKFLRADLRNANLRNVNIDGSVMDESCLFDADLTGANFSPLVPPLAKAYLCRTIVPEGISVDRDCNTAPACCYT